MSPVECGYVRIGCSTRYSWTRGSDLSQSVCGMHCSMPPYSSPGASMIQMTVKLKSPQCQPCVSPACSWRMTTYFSSSHGHSTTGSRSEEHTSELQSHVNIVCRL